MTLPFGCYCRTKRPCPIHGPDGLLPSLRAFKSAPVLTRRLLCRHLGRHLFDAEGNRRWQAPT